jgi:hypothetical protein
MPDAALADVLIVAAPSQRGRIARLTQLLTDRSLSASYWPSDVDDDPDAPSLSLAEASQRASLVLLLADESFASGRLGERSEISEALTKVANRLAIVVIDVHGRSSLSLRSIDVYPTRGVLLDLDESARVRALEQVVIEIAGELDRTCEPQPAKLFEEYRLLFESTDRLVQRRRETTQVFFGVNAALSAVIAFLVKDLALPGPRLSIVTVPLFIMGMVASLLWRRTIEQYAVLIDWRYRQIRRMERRGFVGSYRLFNREWEAIYAPRPPGAFGFSGLESAVPQVFMVLHALGVCFALAVWLGLLERLGF